MGHQALSKLKNKCINFEMFIIQFCCGLSATRGAELCVMEAESAVVSH